MAYLIYRKIILVLALLLCSFICQAQKTVPLSEIEKYVDQEVLICDSVYSSRALRTLTILNLGKEYPFEKLNLVILQDVIVKFPKDADKFYLDKKIYVQGKIVRHGKKLQIFLVDPTQVKIL